MASLTLRALLALCLLLPAHALASPCPEDDCLDKGLQAARAEDPRAISFFTHACDTDQAAACTELGYLYLSKQFDLNDDTEAYRLAEKGCTLGHGLGCNNAFILIRDGRFSPPSPDTGLQLAQRACALKNPQGCYLEAALTQNSDPKRSEQALHESCEHGFAQACATVAHRLLQQEGLLKTHRQAAVSLMARACELDNAHACLLIAQWSLDGTHGLVVNHTLARQAFQNACELGESLACVQAEALQRGSQEATLARKRPQTLHFRFEAPHRIPKDSRVTLYPAGIAPSPEARIASGAVRSTGPRSLELAIDPDDAPKIRSLRPGHALLLAWELSEASANPNASTKPE